MFCLTHHDMINSDNPLWTESALKYYEEQELSMNLNPLNEHLSSSSAQDNQTQPSSIEQNTNSSSLLYHHHHAAHPHHPDAGHYTSILEATRTRLRQRMPDNTDVSS